MMEDGDDCLDIPYLDKITERVGCKGEQVEIRGEEGERQGSDRWTSY